MDVFNYPQKMIQGGMIITREKNENEEIIFTKSK